VISRAAELQPERFRVAVASGAERLRLNLKLTTLNLAIPVVPLEKPAPRLAELVRILEEMEMRSTAVEARQRYGQPELF
jgi:DNA polymerase-1